MVGEPAQVLQGKQELLAAALGRATLPLYPGGHVCLKHLATILLMLLVNNPSLYVHAHRVRLLTHHLTCVLHLPQGQATAIEWAALLHDIGNLVIPTSMLQQASRLTHGELMRIRRHPAYGAVMLKQMGMLSRVTHIVYHHHDHWDGRGYPAGLQGEAIPLGARIVASADAFEVMTSHRPYQAPRPPIQALEELRSCADTKWPARQCCQPLHVERERS